ncbi:MAG: DUF481 domain-containing protein [Limnohabitans sp.]|nr:DUF481 domain-containing protein [Limnohabitans sp.]
MRDTLLPLVLVATTSAACTQSSLVAAVSEIGALSGANSSLAELDVITLVGGDTLRGTVVAETDMAVTLDHPALGRIEVARERIASVTKAARPEAPTAQTQDAATGAETSASGEPVVVAQAAAEPAPPVAVLPAPVPPPPAKPDGSWKFSLSLGFTGSETSNQSNWSLRAAGAAKRESEQDRTTITAEYYFNTANSVNTDNNLLVQGLEEFLFKDSKWEAFVQGTYQYDAFLAWEQRAGAYVGPGYRLLEGEPVSLKVRAGAGASYEFPSSEWTPELILSDELAWTIDERSKLKQGLDFYPDIDNLGEYRFIVRLDYEIALSPKGDLKGTAGVRDEYDSYVESSNGGTSNDLKIYAGIKVDF